MVCIMTPIHAKVASTEKYGDQYRLIVDLVPSEFLGHLNG
jgi:hypothetical protein